MIITSYILAPLVGGIIGYVTNDIAIRMLFRPHTAKHIMEWGHVHSRHHSQGERTDCASSGHGYQQLPDESGSTGVVSPVEQHDGQGAHLDWGFFATRKPNSETVTNFLEHYLSREEVSVLVDGTKECMSMQKESCLICFLMSLYGTPAHYLCTNKT